MVCLVIALALSSSPLLATPLAATLPDHPNTIPAIVNLTVGQAKTALGDIPLKIEPDLHMPTASEIGRKVSSQSRPQGEAVPEPIPAGYFISVALFPLPPDPGSGSTWILGAALALMLGLICWTWWRKRRLTPP